VANKNEFVHGSGSKQGLRPETPAASRTPF
jgi:hypothetical protein